MEHSSSFINRNLPTLLDASKRTHFNPFSKALLHTSPSQHGNTDLLSDISHPRVRELILAHKDINSLLSPAKEGGEVRDNKLFLKQFEERRWLTKKGRKYLIDFDNRERKEMKQYFNSLDEKKTGSIGIDQLEELLLSVGLFQTREEIKALIDSVDEDKSGKIEFDEFLSMIQNDEGQNEEIVTFFKTVIGGNATRRQSFPRSGVTEMLEKYPYPKGLPFEMVVSHIRRKHMMTALNIGRSKRQEQFSSQCLSSTFNSQPEHTPEQIAKGQRVMQALQKMYQRKLIKQIKEKKRGSQGWVVSNRPSMS